VAGEQKAKIMTTRRSTKLWNRSFKRILNKITRTATRAGAKAMVKSLRGTSNVAQRTSTNAKSTSTANWRSGVAIGAASIRRYRLYEPPGVIRSERLPLMVMLHGCGQDGETLATSTKMNRIAARKRFFVLYPEQERLANAQGCWNWYDTRSGRAQREVNSIDAVIDQVCQLQSIDPDRIVLAGFSAGASMAALLAIHRPARFQVVAMHSGVSAGVAHSSAGAIMAMRGRTVVAAPLPVDLGLGALLVIQGSGDRVVVPVNGNEAARLWAIRCGAVPSTPRIVRRGTRYPVTTTDYKSHGHLMVSLCEINGLGHAWSGGAAGHAYSDPKGPDASSMIWTFATKQFAFREKSQKRRLPELPESESA
jgi:poly(hydroxyalkanoate) depolymerase family esterase